MTAFKEKSEEVKALKNRIGFTKQALLIILSLLAVPLLVTVLGYFIYFEYFEVIAGLSIGVAFFIISLALSTCFVTSIDKKNLPRYEGDLLMLEQTEADEKALEEMQKKLTEPLKKIRKLVLGIYLSYCGGKYLLLIHHRKGDRIGGHVKIILDSIRGHDLKLAAYTDEYPGNSYIHGFLNGQLSSLKKDGNWEIFS